MPKISYQRDAVDAVSFNVLVELHNQAWQSFYQRREHEYKLCVAFWTLYALAIAQIVVSNASLNLTSKLLFSVSVIFLMSLHIQWIRGLASANLLDRKFAFYYGERLRELGNIELPSAITGNSRYMKPNEKYAFVRTVLNWNHGAEIGVTVILTAVVVVLLFYK